MNFHLPQIWSLKIDLNIRWIMANFNLSPLQQEMVPNLTQPMAIWRFLKIGLPQSSSIFESDFPWNNPSSYWGSLMAMDTTISLSSKVPTSAPSLCSRFASWMRNTSRSPSSGQEPWIEIAVAMFCQVFFVGIGNNTCVLYMYICIYVYVYIYIYYFCMYVYIHVCDYMRAGMNIIRSFYKSTSNVE